MSNDLDPHDLDTPSHTDRHSSDQLVQSRPTPERRVGVSYVAIALTAVTYRRRLTIRHTSYSISYSNAFGRVSGENMVLIGFSTPRSWNVLSALIRTLTRSTASHCWLLVEDPLFHLRLVLEAGATGFRLVSFARFVKTNKVTALVMPAVPLEQGLPLAAAWLGEKYDVLGLFGMLIMFLKQWATSRLARNPFYSARALFCSEAVVRVLRAAKFPKIEQLGNKNTTPGQLLQWLNENPANLVYQGESLRLWQHLKAKTKFDSRPPELASLEHIPPVPELAT